MSNETARFHKSANFEKKMRILKWTVCRQQKLLTSLKFSLEKAALGKRTTVESPSWEKLPWEKLLWE